MFHVPNRQYFHCWTIQSELACSSTNFTYLVKLGSQHGLFGSSVLVGLCSFCGCRWYSFPKAKHVCSSIDLSRFPWVLRCWLSRSLFNCCDAQHGQCGFHVWLQRCRFVVCAILVVSFQTTCGHFVCYWFVIFLGLFLGGVCLLSSV